MAADDTDTAEGRLFMAAESSGQCGKARSFVAADHAGPRGNGGALMAADHADHAETEGLSWPRTTRTNAHAVTRGRGLL